MKNSSYFKSRMQSFSCAFSGLVYMFRHEPNARIHAVIALIATLLGAAIKLSAIEWCLLAIVTGMVFTSEAINSAIEQSVDLTTPEYNEKAKRAKDLGAGAVLVSAFAAVVTGFVIFLPKIICFLLNQL